VNIVVADDNPVSRRLLEAALVKWGYQPILTAGGAEALEKLRSLEQAAIVILDWLMPGMDGLEVCREVRQDTRLSSVYVILLTSKNDKEDIIKGLESGADDYVVKPFDFDELRARVQVGIRVVQLQSALADRVRQLEQALQRERQLMGLLPICSYCKKIRDDKQQWQPMESYLARRSEVRFSHSICPECAKKWEREWGG
jgi:DNA-binding response OmpR family regulator